MKSGIKRNSTLIVVIAFALGLSPFAQAMQSSASSFSARLSEKKNAELVQFYIKQILKLVDQASKQIGKEAGLIAPTRDVKVTRTPTRVIVSMPAPAPEPISPVEVPVIIPAPGAAAPAPQIALSHSSLHHEKHGIKEEKKEKHEVKELIKELHHYAQSVDKAKNEFFNTDNNEKYAAHYKRAADCLPKIKKIKDKSSKLLKKYPESKAIDSIYAIASDLEKAQGDWTKAINPANYKGIPSVTLKVGFLIKSVTPLQGSAKKIFENVDAKLNQLKILEVGKKSMLLLESMHTILDHTFNMKITPGEALACFGHRFKLF